MDNFVSIPVLADALWDRMVLDQPHRPVVAHPPRGAADAGGRHWFGVQRRGPDAAIANIVPSWAPNSGLTAERLGPRACRHVTAGHAPLPSPSCSVTTAQLHRWHPRIRLRPVRAVKRRPKRNRTTVLRPVVGIVFYNSAVTGGSGAARAPARYLMVQSSVSPSRSLVQQGAAVAEI